MPCYAPFNIQDPKFNNPKIRIEVPCGKCAGCLQSRRDDWTNRLTHEMDVSTSAHFITLTYAEEYITYGETHQTLVKSDLQNFFQTFKKKEFTQIRSDIMQLANMEQQHYVLIITLSSSSTITWCHVINFIWFCILV